MNVTRASTVLRLAGVSMRDEGRFDEVARAYDDTVQRAIGASGETVQFFADLKVRLMSRALTDAHPSTILDFGCGIGNTTRSLAAVFQSARIIGFDISPESLAVARELTAEFRQVTYVSAVDGGLPLPDASIDAAFASCVFHHIELRERAHWIAQLRRVLRPGAALFLFEHNPYNPLTVRVVRRVPFDEGVLLLRPSEAAELLRSGGFEASRPWFYFFFPSFLRALRPLEKALKHVPVGAQYFVIGRRPRIGA